MLWRGSTSLSAKLLDSSCTLACKNYEYLNPIAVTSTCVATCPHSPLWPHRSVLIATHGAALDARDPRVPTALLVLRLNTRAAVLRPVLPSPSPTHRPAHVIPVARSVWVGAREALLRRTALAVLLSTCLVSALAHARNTFIQGASCIACSSECLSGCSGPMPSQCNNSLCRNSILPDGSCVGSYAATCLTAPVQAGYFLNPVSAPKQCLTCPASCGIGGCCSALYPANSTDVVATCGFKDWNANASAPGVLCDSACLGCNGTETLQLSAVRLCKPPRQVCVLLSSRHLFQRNVKDM
jgi:hypothetical protein